MVLQRTFLNALHVRCKAQERDEPGKYRVCVKLVGEPLAGADGKQPGAGDKLSEACEQQLKADDTRSMVDV